MVESVPTLCSSKRAQDSDEKSLVCLLSLFMHIKINQVFLLNDIVHLWMHLSACLCVGIEPQLSAVHGASGLSPRLWSVSDIWGYGVLLWGNLTPSAAPESSRTAASSGSPPRLLIAGWEHIKLRFQWKKKIPWLQFDSNLRVTAEWVQVEWKSLNTREMDRGRILKLFCADLSSMGSFKFCLTTWQDDNETRNLIFQW